MSLRKALKSCLVSICPSLRMNSGACRFPLTAKNGRMAVTGQMGECVLPRNSVAPCLKGVSLGLFNGNSEKLGVGVVINSYILRERWTSLS